MNYPNRYAIEAAAAQLRNDASALGKHALQRVAELALAALDAEPNEARELCFARCILGNKLVTAEVRALAEDTVAKAKFARRTR